MNSRTATLIAGALLLFSQLVYAGSGHVDLMAQDRLQKFKNLLPQVDDSEVQAILTSADTMWYDKHSLIPGYQDSWGDNVVAPVGMRPNTIRSGLIDLAVPGGHGKLFEQKGKFNFPFGVTAGLHEAKQHHVLTFWQPPRIDGKVLPVVYWQEKGAYEHRYRWLFPKGTVFGEVLYVMDDNLWRVFEIRVRKRYINAWATQVYRPFPTASSFAAAIKSLRPEKAEWQANSKIDTLLLQLRQNNLSAKTLTSSYYSKAWEPTTGYLDTLTDIAQPDFIAELLKRTSFKSMEGQVWKRDGDKECYAPTIQAGFSIVPPGYLAGLIAVNDVSCQRCHSDAGRPFKHFYSDLTAYGELWGEDEIFSWHPFQIDNFVDSQGQVRNFNYDNRIIRKDFIDAGLIAKYQASVHSSTVYKQLPASWRE